MNRPRLLALLAAATMRAKAEPAPGGRFSSNKFPNLGLQAGNVPPSVLANARKN